MSRWRRDDVVPAFILKYIAAVYVYIHSRIVYITILYSIILCYILLQTYIGYNITSRLRLYTSFDM